MHALPRYPFRRPAELDGAPSPRRPVVVVGGGLTGLTLALDLARRGVPVVLLDDDDTVGVRGLASRGIVWAQRTLDVFERLGVAPRIAAKGVRWNVGRVLCADRPVTSFTLQDQPDLRHNGFANLQQYYVEQFLVEALQAQPLADLRWRSEVVGLQAQDVHVALQVRTPEGDYALQADWVIACDGAFSPCRKLLGLAPHVFDRTEDHWIIIDVTLRDCAWPEERWTWLDASANNGRAVWRHKMADDTWRLDFQLGEGEDPVTAATPEAMRRRVRALIGGDIDFDVAWSGAWAYRHECLESMRHGRVLFAGDAAHLVAPFGARGGNGGVQDADNLGWKLALVVKQGADASLLDSYSLERREAALENIRQARRSSRFVYPRGLESVQLWRDAIMALAPSLPWAARLINTGRLSAPAVYGGDSPLVDEGGGAALPDVMLNANGASLHRLLGPWFTLLCFSGSAAACAHPLVKVVAVDPHCDAAGRAALQRQLGVPAGGGQAWLVRPDQHIASRRAHDPAFDLDQALASCIPSRTEPSHGQHPATA
ncbi:FAD-dependent oxidoreductase [Variovorax sp. dw_308]|uniref:FAD-dependent oxidoreductase n=1 Tax=Variovorax sp. dw_308 TaxID=2721546 RepID=UPI001C4508BB|nr:FAD-dependent oxidoreductase [Variovorax sp. dw_308]